jgi:REP element-mobilizing transposase RayT
MDNFAILRNSGEYTIFEFNGQMIRFITSSKLERYTKVLEWDHGYLVVMAKYNNLDEVEEYIDLVPILERLYYDVEAFLKPIKEVRIEYF